MRDEPAVATTPGVDLVATARWTAAVRARESGRVDRLFEDPWAAALAGEAGRAWIADRPEAMTSAIVIRTRYFDQWLKEQAAIDANRQVVLPGSGLDTRAYRLSWPDGTTLYELDHASVLAHKTSVLEAAGAAPTCDLRAVDADLAASWADGLVAAGFDSTSPAVWLLEGLLFYLPSDTIERILGSVTALAAAGSKLGFDVVNAETLSSPYTRTWIEMQAAEGAPWIGSMEDPIGFLSERGWAAQLTQPGAPDANYGRWTLPVIPATMPNMPHNWYVTAEKTD